MYDYLNQWYNPKPSWIRLMPSFSTGTQHTWYGCSSISNVFAICAFWAILCLFYCSPPHHTTSKYCWCILTIHIYGRYLGVQTMVQFLLLKLWQPISEWYFWAWKYDMFAKMQYLCSGGKNKGSMMDCDPWLIPYGYRMDDRVVSWCTMLVLGPKEKLLILLVT